MTPLQRACIVLAWQLAELRRWEREAAAVAKANPPKATVSGPGNRLEISFTWLPPPSFDS